jgi:muramoyltetrapeptide carboxypeptidase
MSHFLKSGDNIGLVAPAGHVTPSEIHKGIKILSDNGFYIRESDHLYTKYRYFSGKVQERVNDLDAMLTDKDIKAIFAVRGGSGSSQLLPYINFNLWKKYPKLFVGFSDISSLQWALWNKVGLISFSGMALTLQLHNRNPYQRLFLDHITGKRRSILAKDLHHKNIGIVRKGKAEGILLGGNLSIIVSLLGTPYFPTKHQNLLFFVEEINEPLYRIERAFVQLAQAGFFKNLKGMVLGRFIFKNRFINIWPIIKPLIPNNIPIISNFPYGHFASSCAFPVGVQAFMSTDPLKISWQY